MFPDLPGWNSLPAVARYHNWAEMAGIIILALLVITEVIAYQYGHRKDDLTEKQQSAADRRHDEEMAHLHVEAGRLAAEAESAKASIANSNARAAEATRRAADAQLALENLRAPRSLTEQQQRAISSALSSFSGQTYWAMLPASSLDADPLWVTLSSVLDKAGWVQVDPPGLKIGTPPHGVGMISQPGIHIGIAPSQKDVLSAPALALLSALRAANLITDASLDPSANEFPTAIVIVIGLKPQ